jgi:peptide/nickel transport system ATP-binding protein
MIEQSKKASAESESVIEVNELAIAYETRKGDVPAVRGVSFQVRRGETLGIVGESGCGKSTVALGIVGSLGRNGRFAGGSINFQGEELMGRSFKELRHIRGNQIAMVYQDPTQALNPALKLGRQLAEVLTTHKEIPFEEAWQRSVKMLERVRIPDAAQMMHRYPHQVSGGQKQRVVIAMALLTNPSLLIMDEPTTALDVTIEAQVLDLVDDLKSDFDTAIIFISHNLGVVARVCDNIAVMYAGVMVEKGPTKKVFARSLHPYTLGLMDCIPKLGMTKTTSRLIPIRGQVPVPTEIPEKSCIFYPRCDFRDEICSKSHPGFLGGDDDHYALCFFANKISQKIKKKTVFRNNETEHQYSTVKGTTKDNGDFLYIDHLKVYYPHRSGVRHLKKREYVKAVDDVSLKIREGETLGIVGESGCGKSTLARGIIGLEDVTGGGGEFVGFDLSTPLSKRNIEFIKEIQMVFQNPDSTLNPSYPVGKQIARPVKRFGIVPRRSVDNEVYRLLRAVNLAEHYYTRFPRQLSGGEKQRVGIARALASRPGLVILDEPLSALDVSVQASVINLLLDLQETQKNTMIFIAHDLSVVRYIADDVAVMYMGQIVERGPADAIYAPPYHPYTEALLSAVPIPDPTITKKRIRLLGEVPSSINPPTGCRFSTRCQRREMLPDNGEVCEREEPQWQRSEKGNWIFCHIPVVELSQVEPIVHDRMKKA